jgi:hypothetical protein
VTDLRFQPRIGVLIGTAGSFILLGCPTGEPEGDSPVLGAVIDITGEDLENRHVVDFGEVNAGDAADQLITIRNVGTDTLQVQNLVLSNLASFEIVDRGALPQLLVAQESIALTLRYSPLQDERLEAELVVTSSDRETPEVRVRLIAEGLAPTIRVEPETWDFGDMTVGCVNVIELTVSNVGRAPLTLDTLWFEDPSGLGELTLIHSIPAGTVLDRSDTVTVEVHYVPIDEDPDTGFLHLETNDPSQPDKTAALLGDAHFGTTHTDEFTQTAMPPADILWVVGNSSSMADEQAALAAGLSPFFQILDLLAVEYHVSVLTTDTADGGTLQGPRPVVTPSTPDPAGTMGVNVDVGTAGSASSRGFQSVALCYSSGACLGGFDRGDTAGLRIIFVSDRQEDSTALGTVADYVDYLQALRSDPDDVILSDISGGLSGCSGAGGSAGTSSDYLAASFATGGFSGSICESAWTAMISSIAWLTPTASDSFELSQTPFADTIDVQINGAGIFVGWTFNSAINTVIFDLGHIPDDGDEIDVTYTVLDGCDDVVALREPS